jgi:hypothetical protein
MVAVLLLVGVVLGAGLMAAAGAARSRVVFSQPQVITRVERQVEMLDERMDAFREQAPRLMPTVPPPDWPRENLPELSWETPPRVDVVTPQLRQTSWPGWIVTTVLSVIRLALNVLIFLMLAGLGLFLLWRHYRRPQEKSPEKVA